MSRVMEMGNHMPSLHIPYPQCGHCGEDVQIEDGAAWCDGCLIQWNRIEDGEPAVADGNHEGAEVPCAIVDGKQDSPHDDKRGNHYIPGPPKPCILPSGHGGHHLCPYDVEVTP